MRACKQCPHVVGDATERDCGFPDCVSVSLTKPQRRALSKLSTKRWATAAGIHERRNVLDSLVKKGLVKTLYMPGYLFFPRTCIGYRLVVDDEQV